MVIEIEMTLKRKKKEESEIDWGPISKLQESVTVEIGSGLFVPFS